MKTYVLYYLFLFLTDLDGIKEKAKFIKKKFKKLNKICANDTPPTSCKCLDDSVNAITPPFADPLTILGKLKF